MKGYLLPLAAIAFLFLLPISALATADDDFEKDAQYAEGNPPMVPHKMEPGTTGDACLVCHLEGKNGAPPSSHAVRIDCVQCHGQGEIRAKKAAFKQLKFKTKKKHKENQ